MQELKEAIKNAAQELFGQQIEPELSRPDEQFGDWSTNLALQLAAKLGKNPKEIAAQLAGNLQNLDFIEKTDVAGPGFINFTLTNEVLARSAWKATDLPQPNKGKEILVEFGDPNP